MLRERLASASDSPDLDARLLLAHALGVDRSWLVAHAEETLAEEALRRLWLLVQRRARGEPLAYILGEAWFFGRRFLVNGDVLVPRPETECVVEAAIAELRARCERGVRLHAADVGTGSGVLALTLAAELGCLDAVASDISAPALDLARRNAALLGVAERVTFVCGNLAEPLKQLGPYDCIVANLPYVPTRDLPVAPNPVTFEPRLAVDGGADGLALYRGLVRDLAALLRPQGTAFLETAPDTAERLGSLVQAELPRAHIEIGEDFAGLERWVAVVL